ncbi:MAG: hypothetical protein H0T76_12560 [Nannocystis sp.]|nr:hypothetical protein [Nannocystis sp.]MBA3547310.1 hypothetical protein [Nannocystis sp.]
MAPPPLPPLSCVAGSLALSFTGATQPVADPMTRAAVTPEVAEPPQLPDPPPAAATTTATTTATPATTPATTSTIAPVIVDAEQAPGVSPIVVAWKPPVVPAQVARPYLLRPTEKRFFFQLFVGGSKTLLGGYTLPYGGGGMDFKLEGVIGGHGKKRKSLAGAAVVQVRTGVPFSSFTLAPRLQWDKQIVPDHAIYLTTTLTMGYRMSTYGAYGIQGLAYGYHGGMAAFGWGVSAIVAERLLLTFRPVNPELEFVGATGFSINWDVFGGLGVVW